MTAITPNTSTVAQSSAMETRSRLRALRARISTNGTDVTYSTQEGFEAQYVLSDADNTGSHNVGTYEHVAATPATNRDIPTTPNNTPTSGERHGKRALVGDDIEWSPSPKTKRRVDSSDDSLLNDSILDTDPDVSFSDGSTNGQEANEDVHNYDTAVINLAKRLEAQAQPDGKPATVGLSNGKQKELKVIASGPVDNAAGLGDPEKLIPVNAKSSQQQPSPKIKTLPAHVFLVERKVSMWSKILRDEQTGASIYQVTYVPSSDPWIESADMRTLMDDDLATMGFYENLPSLPLLQFIIQSTPPNNEVAETDRNGDIVRHAMSIEAFESFGLLKSDAIRLITFTRSGLNGNPARDTPLLYAAKSYSLDLRLKFFKEGDVKNNFFAVDRVTHQPVVFWSLGVITTVYMAQPCHDTGRAAYRGVHAVLMGWERDRLAAFFSMVFRSTQLIVQMDGNSAFVFQTRFQSKSSAQGASSRTTTLDSFTSGQGNGLRVGRFTIPTYRKPIKEAAPPPYFNYGYAFSANIPVFDARGFTVDPMHMNNTINKLPRFTEEIQEGTSAFIGYGAGVNLYEGKWKISFYIRYLVVLAVPDF